jgi:hypothetical protein
MMRRAIRDAVLRLRAGRAGRPGRSATWLGALAAAVGLAFCTPDGLAASSLRVRGRIVPPPGESITVLRAVRVELAATVDDDSEAARRMLTGAAEPPPLATARPDGGGAFELRVPESGFYQVIIKAEGSLSLAWDLWPLLEDTELPPASLARAGPLRVSVLGPDGQPAAGVLVGILDPALGDSPRSPRHGYSQEVEPGKWHPARRVRVTAANGVVVLLRASGEALGLVASDRGFRTVAQVPAGESSATLRFLAHDLRWITARGGDGRPIGGAVVRSGTWPLGITGEDGRLAVGLPEAAGFPLRVASRDGRVGDAGDTASASAPELAGGLVARLEPPRRVAGQVVDAASRVPLAGALVVGELGPPLRTAADGGFRLPAPATGEGWVQVAMAGYLPAGVPLGQAERNGPLVFALERAGGLSGRVVDGAGKPIAGAVVVATPSLSRRPWRTGGTDKVEARSQPEGRFGFASLLAGEAYTITATAEGFAPASVVATATAAAAGPATGTVLGGPGAGGSARAIELVLGEGAAASGRVLDRAGRPLAGAKVELERSGDPRHPSTPELYAAEAGSAGLFQLRHLPAGRYDLVVRLGGFAPTLLGGIDIPAAAARVDLGALTLDPGAVIAGRVVDGSDQPVAGAKAGLTPVETYRASYASSDSAVGRALQRSVETGPDGSFRFEDLASGERFDLKVVKPGYVPMGARGISAPPAEPLRFALISARTLKGRVVDADGEPVADARVFHQRGDLVWSLEDSATTDAHGEFALGGLAPGAIDLQVNVKGYQGRLVRTVQIPRQGDPENLEIVLPRGSTLEGGITDESGAPVAGAWVEALPKDPSPGEAFWPHPEEAAGQSGSQGRYTLRGLATGTYMVTARGDDGQWVSADVEIGPGVNHLDLAWKRSSELSGQVSDETGLPIADVEVALGDPVKHVWRLARSVADGSFVFPRVLSGSYTLTAKKEGFISAAAAAASTIEVAGQSIRGVQLQLSHARATVSGKLLGVPADQSSRVRIEASNNSLPDENGFFAGPLDAPGFADQDGGYRIPDLAPGEWRVEAVSGSGQRTRRLVTIEPETRDVTLDLDFRRGSTISGRLTVDQRPFPATQVSIQPVERGLDDGGWADTDSEGAFVIRNLEPGPHTLVVIDRKSGIAHGRTIDLAATGGTTEIAVELESGAVSGRVSRPDGGPLAGATVQLERAEPSPYFSAEGPVATTDASGGFLVPLLSPGGYRATVALGGAVLAQSRFEVRPHETSRAEIVIKAGAGRGITP